MDNNNTAPRMRHLSKLHSVRGMSWLVGILLVLVTVLFIVVMIPVYHKYQTQGEILACATALDTARRQLAVDYMFDGFENDSAEAAKKLVTEVMLGWDDLCPDGGNVYIVPRGGDSLAWDVVCGLHGSDRKQCTRLNSDTVLEQLREALRLERQLDNPYPESLEYTLHHRTYTAYLTDEPVPFKRGTKLTDGYQDAGIVAYYSIVGHSDFGADSGLEEGQIWYFSYADEEHCAAWSSLQRWTGDSYDVVS